MDADPSLVDARPALRPPVTLRYCAAHGDHRSPVGRDDRDPGGPRAGVVPGLGRRPDVVVKPAGDAQLREGTAGPAGHDVRQPQPAWTAGVADAGEGGALRAAHVVRLPDQGELDDLVLHP